MVDWSFLLQRNAADIQTPALIIDLEAFERNVAKMAGHCRDHGISLRAHAKTHKCAEIARRQVAAGAIGQCCASLDEAEMLVGAGIGSVLITSPLVTEAAIHRLLKLNAVAPGLMAVADNPQAVARLAQAAVSVGQTLKLLVDIDIGHHRTGIAPGAAACALAAAIAQSPNLEFVGIQGYAGHLMHLADRAERQERSPAALEQLRLTRDQLRGMGLSPRIVTGGGTGSFDIDPAENVLTELQAGSYVFMDRQYNDVWTGEGVPFETSLFVLTRVVSANHPGMATTDAGLKAFSTDADAPVISFGPGESYGFFGDEYGRLTLAENVTAQAGDAVACVVPHCDPTVNLYGHYLVVRGGELVDRWPITSGKYRT
ncbi:MAG TPA: DSD1 family PLP-dependent enzyme [Rhizomicrobium sp.]|jgi:D-serine deaminase-like pyridoxal phosphate-dependent protein